MKKLTRILSMLAAGLTLATLVGCNQTTTASDSSNKVSSTNSQDPSITGFDVPNEVNASFGTTFTLPTFTPLDENGNVYGVSVKVTCEGKDVLVVSNKIDIDQMKDYIVVYTLNGFDVSKTMTIKVKDLVGPTIKVANMVNSYIINQPIELPVIEIVDNIDTELSYTVSIKKDENTILENVASTFTLSESGRYQLVVSSMDSSGNIGTETAEFIVRDEANKGEIEDFSDEFAYECVRAINNNGWASILSEKVTYKGKDAIKINTKDATNTPTKYPGLALTPRISKEEVETLIAEGFENIALEYYIDYSGKRSIYQKWTGKQYSYATTLNQWSFVNLPLSLFLEGYDAIAAQEVAFFYIGNEDLYVEDKTCADFDFYVSSIYVTKDVSSSITFKDGGLDHQANCDTLLDISAIEATFEDATFTYTYFNPIGDELVLNEGKLPIEGAGVYQIVATPNEKCYLGSSTYEIVVKATLSQVEDLINTILTASDITAMRNEADTLQSYYETLSEADKAQIDAFEYIRATNLLVLKDDVLYYFDQTAGKDQISLEYTIGNPAVTTALTTKNGVHYVTDVKYGNESGSTKIAFNDVNPGVETWPCPFTIVLDTAAITNLDQYQYIRFYIQGYCYNTARPISFAVTVNEKRIDPTINPVDAKNEIWTEVLIPVSSLTGQVKIKIYTHNGSNLFGSVWNDPSRMYVYFSNIVGLKAYDDFAFSDEFLNEESYFTGSSILLDKMVASSLSGQVVATRYFVTLPSGDSEDVDQTSSVAFTTEGNYTFTAVYEAEGYYQIVRKVITVTDPDDGYIYLAKNNTTMSEIFPRGYGTDVVVKSFLEEFEGVKNVIKSSTIVSEGASTNSYKWPGFDLNIRLTLEEIENHKANGYEKFVVPLYVTGSKEQDVVLGSNDTVIARVLPNQWNYLEIDLSCITSTDLSYFMYLYNQGKGNPSTAETDIIYYIGNIYLKQADDFEVLAMNEANKSKVIVLEDGNNVMNDTNATIDMEDTYKDEAGSFKYVVTNTSDYVVSFAINCAFDFTNYDKLYTYLKVSNCATDKIGITLYDGNTRVVDLRHDYITLNEWIRVELPTFLFTNTSSASIRVVCNKWGSIVPANTEIRLSSIHAKMSTDMVMNTVAYGSDIGRISYLDTYNGESEVIKFSTDTALLASSNTWKYPGVRVLMPHSVETLQTLQEEGYTSLSIKMYIEDNKQSSQDIYWGKTGGTMIETINTNEWVTINLPLSDLIADYATYFSNYGTYNYAQYLIYINNSKYSTEADHINVYTSTVCLAK